MDRVRMSNEYYAALLEPARRLEESNQNVERDQWYFGDKLLELIPMGKDGEKNESTQELKDAADYLRAHGFKHSVNTLRNFRDISNVYPAAARAAASYTVHRVVRDKNLLAAIVEIPRPPGQDLTEDFARRMASEIQSMNVHAWHEKREEESAAADKALAEAKKQAQDAAEEAKRAKDEEEKQQAEAKRAEAQKAIEEAQEIKKKNKSLRPPEEVKKAIPTQTMLTGIVLSSTLKSIALKALKMAEEVKNTLEEENHQLHADSKTAIMDIALQVHQDWLDVANSLRPNRRNGKQQSHLSVIDTDKPTH